VGRARTTTGERLSVVADSEADARSIPDTVTIDQARALVGRNEAVWIDPPRAGFQIREE
jgi:hypothetical protein